MFPPIPIIVQAFRQMKHCRYDIVGRVALSEIFSFSDSFIAEALLKYGVVQLHNPSPALQESWVHSRKIVSVISCGLKSSKFYTCTYLTVDNQPLVYLAVLDRSFRSTLVGFVQSLLSLPGIQKLLTQFITLLCYYGFLFISVFQRISQL